MYKKILIGMFLLTVSWSYVSASEWVLPGVAIISRAQW
jgi:hypothetical protein